MRIKITKGLISAFNWLTKLTIGLAMSCIVLSWVMFNQGRFEYTGLEVVYNTLYMLPLIAMWRRSRIGMIGFVIMNICNVFFMEWTLIHFQTLWVAFPAVYASHILRRILIVDLNQYQKRNGMMSLPQK